MRTIYSEKCKPIDIKITSIGSKPGEKLYEELMSEEETRRAVELPNYFSVLPAFRGIYHDIDYSYQGMMSSEITNPYVSGNEPAMSVDEIKKFLQINNLLETPEEQTSSRYWPGDKEEKM